MKKTAFIICLQVVFCTVTHAGVIGLEFQNINGEAYGYAYADGSADNGEMSSQYYGEPMQAEVMKISNYINPPIEHTAEAFASSNGTNSSLSCLASDTYTATIAKTDFSADLLIGTTAGIPAGTPLKLLVNITTSGGCWQFLHSRSSHLKSIRRVTQSGGDAINSIN